MINENGIEVHGLTEAGYKMAIQYAIWNCQYNHALALTQSALEFFPKSQQLNDFLILLKHVCTAKADIETITKVEPTEFHQVKGQH
jgi:hypothetical protein